MNNKLKNVYNKIKQDILETANLEEDENLINNNNNYKSKKI